MSENEDVNEIDKIVMLFHATLSRFITPESDAETIKQISGPDGEGKTSNDSSNSHIAWYTPGIPYSHEQLDFAKVLFGSGDVSGEQYRSTITSFAELTRFLNTIPNLNKGMDREEQDRLAQNTGKLLHEQYNTVLQYSQVADHDPDGENQKKLTRLREKLTKTVKRKNIITDEDEEIVQPSELVAMYEKFKQEYNMAWLAYTNKRRAAQIGSDRESVIDWANNEQVYFNDVRTAFNRWASEGYKRDYEVLTGTIDQIGARSLVNLKNDLMDKMAKARQVDPITNQPFMYTSYFPADFHNSAQGWLQFAYSHEKSKASMSDVTKYGGGGISLRLDFFGAPPGSAVDLSASGGKQEIKEKIDISGFEIEFKICQVMISRPWFNPDFLAYKNWRFSPDANFGEVSDGGKVPSHDGMISSYPVSAYFVSDVKLKMKEFTKESSQVRKFIKAGGGISIGPIRLGGHGGRNELHQSVSVDEKAGSVAVDGLQLVALRCQAVPKSPNPDPNISNWI